ncbi:MAG: RING finger protein, partial [Chloroflexota bacterium]
MSDTSAAPAVATISIRTTLPNSKWLNATCPKCQKPLAEGEQVVLCPKCYTPQHAQCWRDNDNTCAIDSTPARLIE